MASRYTGGVRWWRGPVWWMITIVVCVVLIACGAGRNTAEREAGGEVDVDKLLGTPEQEREQSAEEAEVLRLLGISPGEKAADSLKVAAAAPAETTATNEIERLQRELQARQEQIERMHNELQQQGSRIEELEAQLRRKSAAVTTVSVRGVSEEFRSSYEDALTLYNQHNYRAALSAFARLLATDDRNSLSDNVQYWIGECYYGLGNYNQAVAEFQKVLSFARSNKSDAALLKLGLCYIRLADRAQARNEFEQLIANFPDSEFVDKARTFLSRL